MHIAQTQAVTSLPIALSAHARMRVQQRGIQLDALDALLLYGTGCHDHLGGLICTFDEEGLAQLKQEASPALWRRLQRARNIYAVIAEDGSVITAGHRLKRVKRDRSQATLRRTGRGEAHRRSARCALVGHALHMHELPPQGRLSLAEKKPDEGLTFLSALRL